VTRRHAAPVSERLGSENETIETDALRHLANVALRQNGERHNGVTEEANRRLDFVRGGRLTDLIETLASRAKGKRDAIKFDTSPGHRSTNTEERT
jgi:hypothetical protein